MTIIRKFICLILLAICLSSIASAGLEMVAYGRGANADSNAFVIEVYYRPDAPAPILIGVPQAGTGNPLRVAPHINILNATGGWELVPITRTSGPALTPYGRKGESYVDMNPEDVVAFWTDSAWPGTRFTEFIVLWIDLVTGQPGRTQEIRGNY